MKSIKLWLLATLLLSAACQSSEQAIPTGIAPTEPIAPAATPAQVTSLDLSSSVIQEGDLPPGFEAAQIQSDPGKLPEETPSPDAFFSQALSHNGGPGGEIRLLLFEDELQVLQAYDLLADEMPGEIREYDLGEYAKVASSSEGTGTATLTFVRCHAVISIQLIGTANEDSLLSYAIRLEERIAPLICRGESH